MNVTSMMTNFKALHPLCVQPHTKGRTATSVSTIMRSTVCFSSLEVLTGVTYSIISSIKVQFHVPRGDIPSGR